ncbi:phosphotransferase family protein [Aspergillus saccharolyticus JOP 1030-1]|uniref:Aminoglycoside phosphotransferase domain-containing protein n=1 Tax=Aspergillus saccharolyticus JOP 1030-1 TaxID=1450539 RepID=A0A318ZGM2_9EURO|nr:hypothetical protein BP01DRAFT_402483 [Aspergillus saccharolyticus JOP 1030-1]PYH43723.1 hypothetical protein BP01DRAFT_402483 [Aspergillus saccharolyticus JOP 1030-1]
MNSTDNYLPPSLSAEKINALILSLSLPPPISITPLEVTAAFRSIYLVTFPPSTTKINARPNPDGSISLVLRVSGRQLPRIKTLNEVGVMSWVRANTSIPVPAIIRYDATEDNPISHEFTLLERAPGISVDKIYDTLSDETKTDMDGYVGGLTLTTSGQVTHGPPIDETYWQTPDLEKYWSLGTSATPETEISLETLNPIVPGGFPNYVAFTVSCLNRYISAINLHPSLEPYQALVPQIRAFTEGLQRRELAEQLNQVPYVLAHKDLHFANIMCDPAQPGCPITAVLDWEFSGVVPAPRWNPPRAFLYNMKWRAEDKAEQTRMEAVFEEVCREKGAEWLLEEMQWGSRLQEEVQKVVNHLRAIVEVCPKGQSGEKVEQWKKTVEEGMRTFPYGYGAGGDTLQG